MLTKTEAYSPAAAYVQGLNEAQATFQHLANLLEYEAPRKEAIGPLLFPNRCSSWPKSLIQYFATFVIEHWVKRAK